MKLMCRFDNIEGISVSSRFRSSVEYSFRYPSGKIPVQVGREYRAFGILFCIEQNWVFLCDSGDDLYPKLFPVVLFEPVSVERPRKWVLGEAVEPFIIPNLRQPDGLLSFQELATDPTFYERLINGEELAVKTFVKNRQ